MFRYPTPPRPTEAGYAIAGDRFAILLAGPAAEGLVSSVWDAAAADSSLLEDVLSVIVTAGIHALPDFAVVELAGTSPETLRVAARGEVTIETDAGAVIDGRDARTWTETSLSAVTGFRLVHVGAPEGIGPLPLGLGVARADELAWGRPATPAPPVAARPAPTSTPAPPPAPPAPSLPDETDVLETLSIDRSLFARPLDDENLELPAFLSDDTGDIELPDDRTLLGGRRATPAPTPAVTYVFAVDPGRELPLDRPVVLGRGPRPARHPGARIEAVPSPAKEISGAHLEVRLDGEHLIARDLDSTNGTIVRPRDSQPLLLRGGATLRVPVGTRFDLGDGVTAVFQIAT